MEILSGFAEIERLSVVPSSIQINGLTNYNPFLDVGHKFLIVLVMLCFVRFIVCTTEQGDVRYKYC